jgi:hypothetical protein
MDVVQMNWGVAYDPPRCCHGADDGALPCLDEVYGVNW